MPISERPAPTTVTLVLETYVVILFCERVEVAIWWGFCELEQRNDVRLSVVNDEMTECARLDGVSAIFRAFEEGCTEVRYVRRKHFDVG